MDDNFVDDDLASTAWGEPEPRLFPKREEPVKRGPGRPPKGDHPRSPGQLGILDAPEFRDELPGVGYLMSGLGARRKKQPFKYEKILGIVRDHPGKPALIGRWTRDGKVLQTRRRDTDLSKIRKWLDEQCPLESWSVHGRTTPNSWHWRELWVVFHGPQTQEEHDADLAFRRKQGERFRTNSKGKPVDLVVPPYDRGGV